MSDNPSTECDYLSFIPPSALLYTAKDVPGSHQDRFFFADSKSVSSLEQSRSTRDREQAPFFASPSRSCLATRRKNTSYTRLHNVSPSNQSPIDASILRDQDKHTLASTMNGEDQQLALGLSISSTAYSQDDSFAIPTPHLDSQVHFPGNPSSSSGEYSAQSTTFSISDLDRHLLAVAPQAADMVRRHSDFYPMSEAMLSPQYFSFSLNQDPAVLQHDMKRSSVSHGVVRNQRPSARRFDSMPGSRKEDREQHSSYYSSSLDADSMESYLRSPQTSPTGGFMHSASTNAVPQARKKRNKCTPEQYRQLEKFFARNRNPTGKIREELSRRIQMPERSVQVWFQNKRAKTKINEIKDGVPIEQRTTVSRERMTRTVSAGDVAIVKKRRSTHEGGGKEEAALIPLSATSLCIGEWRRIKPLICLFSQRNQSFTWYLSSESVGFKLECPLASVTKITFSGPSEPSVHEYNEGVADLLGHLTLELSRPPQFYMEVFRSSAKAHEGEVGGNGSGHKAAWRQCTDFTEERQATSTLTHVVSGPYEELKQAVMQLYKASGSVSSLIEVQEHQQDDHIPLDAYNLDASLSGFFSPSSQQLTFGDLDDGSEATIFHHHHHHHQQQQQQLDLQQSHGQSQMEPVSLLQSLSSSNASGIDFTALRIQTPRRVSFSLDPQPQRLPQTSVNDLESFSWLDHPQPNQQQAQRQYQYEIDPLSVSWNMADEGHTAFALPLSAPAYDARTFAEQQQQQQQQYHRASLGNIYSSFASTLGGNLYAAHGVAGDTIDELQ